MAHAVVIKGESVWVKLGRKGETVRRSRSGRAPEKQTIWQKSEVCCFTEKKSTFGVRAEQPGIREVA
jgi:hypothetical protein